MWKFRWLNHLIVCKGFVFKRINLVHFLISQISKDDVFDYFTYCVCVTRILGFELGRWHSSQRLRECETSGGLIRPGFKFERGVSRCMCGMGGIFMDEKYCRGFRMFGNPIWWMCRMGRNWVMRGTRRVFCMISFRRIIWRCLDPRSNAIVLLSLREFTGLFHCIIAKTFDIFDKVLFLLLWCIFLFLIFNWREWTI